jgi:hypothetical protein
MNISCYKSRNLLVASGRAEAFKFVEGFLFMFNFNSIKGGILLYCTITWCLNTIALCEWMSKCWNVSPEEYRLTPALETT